MPDFALVSSALSCINTATQIVKTIKEVDYSLNTVELKAKILELSESLLNSKEDILKLRDTLSEKDEQIKKLEEKLNEIYANEKPTLKGGCYQFEGLEGLYCPACWENDRKKMPVSRTVGVFGQCPGCKATVNRPNW